MKRFSRLLLAPTAVALLATACGGTSASNTTTVGAPASSGGGTSATAPGSGSPASSAAPTTTAKVSNVKTIEGMLPVVDDTNLYSEQGLGKLSDTVKGHKNLVYVPNNRNDSVVVIDPQTKQILRTVKVGKDPQHVAPSWDMKTLYVTNNAEGRTDGSLTPIDPVTGEFGQAFYIDDPYNMYFTPDGKSALVVAEAFKRLDFYDPVTWKMQRQIFTPRCGGINHADFSIDGSFAVFTCEFAGGITKIDWRTGEILGHITIDTPARSMPQDVRVSPDGKLFYVADLIKDGLHIVDAQSFTIIDFVKTGVGTHGIYPARDGSKFFIANRGQNTVFGVPKGKGTISVFDPKTNTVTATWPIAGGGSPDMGNLSTDGTELWLSGRYDDEVYVFNTTTGEMTHRIKVGQKSPHGLLYWPQPGRYSLGHTGNMR
jgi:YVTN family beta-propeller protein